MTGVLMGALCFFAVIAGTTWLGGLIVFAPLHERTLLFKVQNRFRIADIISLGILLQMAVGGMLAIMPSDEGMEERAAIAALMSAVAIHWWIGGLRMLSRAGVEKGLHRAAFLTLLLPSGYVAILLSVGIIVFVPASLDLLASRGGKSAWQIALGVVLLTLPIVGICWCIVCHRICRHMANRARDDHAKRDGIEFDQVQESDKRDPTVAQYLVGRQQVKTSAGVWMEDPVIMATSADPPEPVEGVTILDGDRQPEQGKASEDAEVEAWEAEDEDGEAAISFPDDESSTREQQ